MNFEKYSKQNFDALGLDSQEARELADELQEDVAKEIYDALLPAFLRIIEGLNAHGHHLKPYDEIRVGEISFRDESVGGECRLRLACDVVISAGYSHTITLEEAGTDLNL